MSVVHKVAEGDRAAVLSTLSLKGVPLHLGKDAVDLGKKTSGVLKVLMLTPLYCSVVGFG